jgi:hypothetical protein
LYVICNLFVAPSSVVHAEDQEVLQGVAATQLLLLHQPLAPHLLLKPGVLQFLLQLWGNVAACYTDDDLQQGPSFSVPAGCMSIADGSLLLGRGQGSMSVHKVILQ